MNVRQKWLRCKLFEHNRTYLAMYWDFTSSTERAPEQVDPARSLTYRWHLVLGTGFSKVITLLSLQRPEKSGSGSEKYPAS